MTEPAVPRPRPCASCPYRCDVPSGIWHEEEYDKLPRYDGEIIDQVQQGGMTPFFCHQADGKVCSGWLAHRDPTDLLAVRLGISNEHLDPSCAEYTTDVPLFQSGAEAAAHGKTEIDLPSGKAQRTIEKITAVREKRGDPVRRTP